MSYFPRVSASPRAAREEEEEEGEGGERGGA